MTTFSCCMIVKNEEKLLARCLDSIYKYMDEIIIVDTGSTDKTKEIASRYTDKIYDFEWNDDFSAARNYSFSFATKDYIYVPDADEYLDEENQRQLALLKQCIDPQIEIVQMMYNTISSDTVLNIQNEYRPKLFKRVRSFTWVDPIHETVRIEPLVFNSDIVISHAPDCNHSKRDFAIFQKAIKRDGHLSDKITSMYATELYKSDSMADINQAKEYFEDTFSNSNNRLLHIQSLCILARIARHEGNDELLTKILNHKDTSTISELCYELGLYFYQKEDFDKAILYFDFAINDASYALDVRTTGPLSIDGVCKCLYKKMDNTSNPDEISKLKNQIQHYQNILNNWNLPEEENLPKT